MKIINIKEKLIATAALALIVAVFALFEVPCIFRWLFDVECPGCGMSRAVFSVLRLDFRAAFAFHPMFWSLPVLYLYYLYDGSFFARLFNKKFIDHIILSLVALGFLLNWAVKLIL